MPFRWPSSKSYSRSRARIMSPACLRTDCESRRYTKIHKDTLETVARMLDGSTSFRLVVVQTHKGEQWKTRVNNFAIAQAIKQERAKGKAHGMVKRLAERFRVSPDKVKQLSKRSKSGTR
jgi:hypothetical protein